jgi:hypothetical protein
MLVTENICFTQQMLQKVFAQAGPVIRMNALTKDRLVRFLD